MNLPNTLTVSRIFAVPVLVVVLMTGLSESLFGIPRQFLGVAMFLGASITDMLDGYVARRRGQITTLGTLLDPIADKLLISAALISLVENKLAPGWAVVIVIGREFAVSGLRQIASQQGFAIPASKMAKFKMLSQVFAIVFLMLGSSHGAPPLPPDTTSLAAVKSAITTLFSGGVFTARDLQVISYGLGRAIMWTVVISALWSMYNYFKDFYKLVQDRIEVAQRKPLGELLRRRPKLSRRPRPKTSGSQVTPTPPRA